MTKILPRLFILFLCFVSPILFANLSFQQKVDALIAQSLPRANIGIMIQDPLDGKILFQKNADQNFYPASNTKILTSMAALKLLGANFQYQTRIHASLNKIKQGILEDDLVIVFQGDPSFTASDLVDLLYVLKLKGIHTIHGNIIIDDTTFTGPYYAPGWTWDSLPWYYSAPVSSIIINENKTYLKIEPVKKRYSTIIFKQNDPFYKQPIQANVKAVSLEESESKCRLNATVKNNQIQLTGCWPMEYTPTQIELALDNPRLLATNMIEAYFKKQKISLLGNIQFSQSSNNPPAIAIKHSLPLKKLLFKVLAESNNIYTESLTKTIGLVHSGEGSFQRGTQSIKQILSDMTLQDYTTLPLSDGSGQSRYNLLSPQAVICLLNTMYHDPLFTVFHQALSTNGKNGTLQERLREKPLIGKVIAKTGTATGTSALSGYITDKNGKQYIFSIMINNAQEKYTKLKAFENALCKLMIEEDLQMREAITSIK